MIDARPLVRALVPPVAAWLFARALLLVTAVASGFAPFSNGLWMRWDSHLYVLVSRIGYTLVPCEAATGYRPDEWCGTSGWFPLLPLFLRAGTLLHLEPAFTGALVSALAALATLVVVWLVFLREEPPDRAFPLLLIAALFPGSVYLHAVFPMALFTLLATLSLVSALHDRPWIAAVFGFLAAMTHSTAVVLGGALFVFGAWSSLGRPRAEWVRRAIVPPAGVAFGYLSVLTAMRLSTGRWDAFFRIQAKYGHHPSNPLRTLVEVVGNAVRGAPREFVVSGWQSLVTCLVVLACLAGAVRLRRTRPHESVLFAAFALVFWLFPLTMGAKVGFWRSDVLLLPAVVLLRPLPSWVLALLLALVAALLPAMGSEFFHSVIV